MIFIPDNDNTALDVANFEGGAFDVYAIHAEQSNGAAVQKAMKLAGAPLIHTAAGDVTMLWWHKDVLVNKTVGAATGVTLPDLATIEAGHEVLIADAKGDAGTNNITISPEDTETINGAGTLVISANYGYARLKYDGTNWLQVG